MRPLGTAHVIRANARNLPLADDSVDLIVTSPPYFALRSYQDGGEHYAGQIGDEPTPAEFVDSLLEVTRECVRVLKPSGSLWVTRDIGGGKDQYSFDARHNPAALGITGYACACGIFDSTPGNHRLPDPASHVRRSASGRDQGASPDASEGPGVAPPTRPAVVLDPFGGTGTTAMVAKALGRPGISVDMSADYCRLAEWRTNDRDQVAKVLGIAKHEGPTQTESLLDLLDGGAA
jgi:hypothetical protein